MNLQPKASHFINGEYVEDTAGRVIDVVYPATGEVIAKLHAATPALIEKALNAAAAAQKEWAALRPVERARILRRAHDLVRARNDEIARVESTDTGRALSETLYVDAVSVAEALEFYAGVIPAYNGETISLGNAFAYTRREPLGVCIGIGAWNYPFQGAGWKSAPALAAGNAMVFKPSENSPLSALILAEIYKEAGLPDGLFNVVQGHGDVGQALVEHPLSAKVSLTGSVPTGKKVLGLAGSLMKHGTMELGGKSPLIIFEDAPLENAVRGALMANFYSTGQVCTNGTRVFVHRSIHDQLVEKVVERAREIRIGDPLDPEVTMGPLISKAQQEKVLNYIALGKEEGAKLEMGGGIPAMQGMEGGFWIEPTVFTNVTDNMRIAREEIFGPVMSVLAFDDEEEVIARANDTEFGLAAGVFTNNLPRAHRVIAKLQAGMCWINNYNLAPVEVPFGGVKSSGVGRECAMAALDHYTQIKSVYVESDDVVSVF
ncbi:betaine-aldehyde dehydrogenase [Daeguia caeni]|uniref:Betaine-aldehyde dehydrogenase n=1 Tax=Daeguia caeni TaxID=439612 RepID=A0ABV9H6V9_9HYPH